jgi:cytochrome c biogenesis protein CcdA
VTVLIGGALILLGLWMLARRSLYFSVFERFASRIGDPTNVSTRGFLLFGLGYGAASCWRERI